MGAVASQITSLTIVYPTAYSEQIKENIKALRYWPFVWGIHRSPVNSPHKWPVTWKMFPFHDVMMSFQYTENLYNLDSSRWKCVIQESDLPKSL